MTPALVFSASAMSDAVSRFKQMGEQTGWCWAAALTDLVPLPLLQSIVLPATGTASCNTVGDAEYLADAGMRKIFLTGRIVDAELLRRLMMVAAGTKIVTVIDHFRHAELLSQSAVQTGSVVEILIEASLGEQTTGVSPGPDASSLATAAARLPGLKVSGVFVNAIRSNIPPTSSDSAANITSIVTIAEHCLLSIQHVDPECREIVLASTSMWKSSFAEKRVTCLIASPFIAPEEDQTFNIIDEQVHTQPSVCLMATVIARPSLELCVIDTGRIAFGESSILRIASPSGAKVVNSNSDSTILRLLGESRDLRIGDTVRLVMHDPDRLLIRRRVSILEDSSTPGEPLSGGPHIE